MAHAQVPPVVRKAAEDALYRGATDDDRHRLDVLVRAANDLALRTSAKRLAHSMAGRRKTTVLNALTVLEEELPGLMSRWEGRHIPGKSPGTLAAIRQAVEADSPFGEVEDVLSRDPRLHFASHLLAFAAAEDLGARLLSARQVFLLAVLAEVQEIQLPSGALPDDFAALVVDALEDCFQGSWEARYSRAKTRACELLEAEIGRLTQSAASFEGLAVKAFRIDEPLRVARAARHVLAGSPRNPANFAVRRVDT